MKSMPLSRRLWYEDPIGVEYGAKQICTQCGWPFPNPLPSAKQRGAHRKVCGTIKGYDQIMNLEGKTNLQFSSPECHEVCTPEEQESDEDGTNESTSKLRQIEPNSYKSSVCGIKAVVEDGTDERILQKIGSKQLENVLERSSPNLYSQKKGFQEGREEYSEFYGNCEIQEECADERSRTVQLSHIATFEGSYTILPKMTLKELLRLEIENESSEQNNAAPVINNDTRLFDWGPCGSANALSGNEDLSSQQNTPASADAKLLTSIESHSLSEAKKANLKNPHAATQQYYEGVLEDYERRACRQLFEFKDRRNHAVNKSEVSEAKKANLKNPHAATEQYYEGILEDYARAKGLSRQLFEFKDRRNHAVNKSRWRKNIDGVLAKICLSRTRKNPLGGIFDEVDIKSVLKAGSKAERKKNQDRWKLPLILRRQLGCCFSTGSRRRHKKRKPDDWELQLQKYASEYSSPW